MSADLIIPGIFLLVSAVALQKRVPLYPALTDGAAQGLRVMASIAPPLIILLAAVGMLRESGAMDALAGLLAPVFSFFGIPPETAPLVLIRPISGSAALAVGTELMARYGVDSPIGLTAAVMLGSTETTFYTISVYFGAAGVRKTRYAVPAALAADFTGFAAATLAVRVFFPS